MKYKNYFDAAEIPVIRRDYPIGNAFMRRFKGMSRDELRSIQNERFLKVLTFAWKVPFYRRLWGDAGIEPSDIRGLDEIAKLPTFSKSDLMDSAEKYPPIGDYHGLEAHEDGPRPQVVIQTTSGTTGKPQPLIFGPKSREIQNLLLARTYLLQGMRQDDVVHSVYGFGMVNGGHYIRETVVHWIGAQLFSAGTGAETRSAQQVALMRDFNATVLVGFGDFIKRLAEVALENGIEPGRHIRLRMISGHLGPDGGQPLSDVWGGCEVYDWYGVGDTGLIAGEGPDHSGMHVMEDAHYLELTHPDTGAPVGHGETGDMICTCLFKDDIFPIIRFNSHDVTEELAGASPLGLPFRRIAGFRGRSDNMVKLRGINVYPTAIGALLAAERNDFAGEYVCQVERVGAQDEMTVIVEVRAEHGDSLRREYERVLRARLGVALNVAFAQPGGLNELTGVERRQKPIRLIDKRKG
jgi:phenylacetate-CoA ligase